MAPGKWKSRLEVIERSPDKVGSRMTLGTVQLIRTVMGIEMARSTIAIEGPVADYVLQLTFHQHRARNMALRTTDSSVLSLQLKARPLMTKPNGRFEGIAAVAVLTGVPQLSRMLIEMTGNALPGNRIETDGCPSACREIGSFRLVAFFALDGTVFAHQFEPGVSVMYKIELLLPEAINGVTEGTVLFQLTQMDVPVTRRAFSDQRLEPTEKHRPLAPFTLFLSVTLAALNRGVTSRKGEAGRHVLKGGLFKHLLGVTSRAVDLKLAEVRIGGVTVTTRFEGHLLEDPATGVAASAFQFGMSFDQGKTGLAVVESQAGGL